jgi:hypothetical protein
MGLSKQGHHRAFVGEAVMHDGMARIVVLVDSI